MAARKAINSPFVVINADDYYGKEGFVKLAEYLKNGGDCCMAGFVLKNTLSDNGTVTRGICVEEDGWLKEVVETKGISKDTELDMESLVSMNMWGLRPEFMDLLEKGFVEFFENGGQGEFLIPTYIGELLEKKAKIKSALRHFRKFIDRKRIKKYGFGIQFYGLANDLLRTSNGKCAYFFAKQYQNLVLKYLERYCGAL